MVAAMRRSGELARELLAPPLTVAEVGVYLGENALAMLEGLDIVKLYLIDPYKAYQDVYDPVTQEELNIARQTMVSLVLEPYNGRVEWLNMHSMLASVCLVDRGISLDLVYIDANHNADAIADDLEAWRSLVKVGGLLAGHDYHIVKAEVDRFLDRSPRFEVVDMQTDEWVLRRVR